MCFCDQIVEHETQTRVSVIMHHREKHLTSNTAKLATLTLKNAAIYMRGLPEDPFSLDKLNLEAGTLPLYLFPDEDALELNDEFLAKHPGPYHLIVPDGTWNWRLLRLSNRKIECKARARPGPLPDLADSRVHLGRIRADEVTTVLAD